MTTAPWSSGWLSTSTRLDAHVIADSDTVPQIIGGIPIRMRSIQVNIDKPNFMINPTNCSPVLDRLARDRRPGHGRRTSRSYFHAVNCATLGFEPKMTIQQLGGKRSSRAEARTRACNSTYDTPWRRQHQVGWPSPCRKPSRSTSATSATSARGPSSKQNTAPGASRSERWNRNAAARSSADGAGLRGFRLRQAAARRLHPRRPGDAHAGSGIVFGQGWD